MYRPRKHRKLYSKRKRAENYDSDCIFCRLPDEQIIKSTNKFLVTRNIFPYSIWDHYPVGEHWMIIPKRHIEGITELDKAESDELMKLFQEYEALGFNIFTRTPGNSMKTVAHQHTHLIKPTGKEQKFLIYIRKPHIHFHR